MTTMWALVLIAGLALAEVPIPSYQDELTESAWLEVNHLIESGRIDEALTTAEAFEKHVVEDSGIAYLRGLAHRFRGEPELAEQHLRRAVKLDPSRKDAWSDLGEILLASQRYDEARDCFAKVDELLPSGRYSWVGPFRLAEVAAHQRQPRRFEEHMREALRRGFTFRTIERDPNWQKFYADPSMHDSVEKLITVYGDTAILDTLKTAPS